MRHGSAPAQFAVLVLVAAGARAQSPEPEPTALLENAREEALRYSASLPNFICTEVVRRQQDPQGLGRWRALDKLTVKLTYFDHREEYQLMQIDGKPTDRQYLDLGGALSTGEFGTRLHSIFSPRSEGEFHWKGSGTLRKRRVARFSYQIAREHSNFVIQWGVQAAQGNSIRVAYRGEVYVDEETHKVLRFTQQAGIPAGFPISATESTVDYEFAEVGGQQYLLPAHALVTTRSGHYVAENNVQFGEYRKFQSDTSITFDPPPGKY